MPTAVQIHDLVRSHADRAPESIALEAIDRPRLTYGALLEQIDETGRVLSEFGIKSGDRVAVVLENGPELASAFLSISSYTAYGPLNPAYMSPEFEFYLGDLDPAALVVAQGTDSPAIGVARALQIPVLELSTDERAPAGTFRLSGPPGRRADAPGNRYVSSDSDALVLHTSGTTSRPKMVPLTHRNLCTSADNIRKTLNLSPDDRCLNVMPLFHIHGLMGVLLSSICAGASVVCSPGFLAPRFYDWLERFRPTWYSAVPTMHQAILERAPEHRAVIDTTNLRFIRSSSASLPPNIMRELEQTLDAPVIEAYGMTEASHQMACNPLPPHVRRPGSVGPAAGPEITIMDSDGRLLETGETGEIVIRGDNVTAGYASNSEANASAFTSGWFRTGDEGRLDEDGYLHITGRIKEIINRGGEKIAPREIDEVLLEHPHVRQAVAFAVPDDRLGEEVGAALVLDPGFTIDPRDIRRFVADRLAPFTVPRHVVVVDEIPMGATGKLRRVGLHEQLAGHPGLDIPPVRPEARPPSTHSNPVSPNVSEPKSPVEQILADLWQDVLRLDAVSVEIPFLDAGGDSMTAVQLASRVRSAFEVDITLVDFFDAPTISMQARLVEDKMLSDQ